MDKIDIKILNLLQNNSEITIQNIAKHVHLSTTPCWKRVSKLKKLGYIKKTIALLNAEKIGLQVIVFIFITVDNHDEQKLLLFAKTVQEIPEIIECHRMSGAIDYLLKVIVSDIGSYDIFYKKLIKKVHFLKVTSNFVIEKIKQTTEIPIKIPN